MIRLVVLNLGQYMIVSQSGKRYCILGSLSLFHRVYSVCYEKIALSCLE